MCQKGPVRSNDPPGVKRDPDKVVTRFSIETHWDILTNIRFIQENIKKL